MRRGRSAQAIDATASAELRGWLTGAWHSLAAIAIAGRAPAAQPTRLVRVVHARAAADFVALDVCGESLPEEGTVWLASGSDAHVLQWRGMGGQASVRDSGGDGSPGADVDGMRGKIAWEDGTQWEPVPLFAAQAAVATMAESPRIEPASVAVEQEDPMHSELAWSARFERLVASASSGMQRPAPVML